MKDNDGKALLAPKARWAPTTFAKVSIPRIQRRFECLERRRKALLSTMQEVDAEALAFRPALGTWCMLEVLEHVVLSEYYATRALERRARDDGSVQRVDVAARLRSLLLDVALRSPVRFRIPAAARGVKPRGELSLAELEGRWDEVRRRMHAALAGLPVSSQRIAVFRHPVAGWLTAGQTLRFLEAHLLHHRRQLRRLVRASKAHLTR